MVSFTWLLREPLAGVVTSDSHVALYTKAPMIQMPIDERLAMQMLHIQVF